MILYFADRAMNVLGFATTHKISDISIVDDYRTEETDTGVSTLEVTVGYNKASRLKAEAMTEAGNYVLFSDGDVKKFYTIIEEEIDSEKKEVRVYAEDAGLDLINEIAGPFEAEEAHEPEWYINKYIKDSGFEIGLNELPESMKALSWDGESTVTERLASIATKFGGFEISYSFEIRGLKVVHKYINIHEKRGKDVGETLRIGREIKTIRTKKTVANLATALECEGGTLDGEDKPITLEGMGYDDGEFYTSGKKLCSRSALEKWSRYAWEEREGKGDGHIVQRYSYDTTDQETLCKHAIAELKKIYDVGINYEVDINYLPSNVEIGDRVNIVDNEGELYVSTRILEFKKSVTRGEYTATLGEYLIRDKGIDDYLNDLVDKVKEENQNTTLYTWIAYADDAEGNGISLDPDGKAYMGIAENRTTEEPDISDPSIYKWSKIQGEDGIHEVSSVDQYYLSASDTECIGGEWSEEIPDWESGKYIWKRKKITWSDGSVTFTDPVLEKSMNSANESAQEAIKQSQNAAQSAEEARQAAQNAEANANTAAEASQNAQNLANSANEAANDAKNLANTAQAAADEALANVSQINKEVANVKSDASAIREEMKASITAVKEEMAADYTKKTETETVEANLRAEISKSAAEIQTTMESNYAKKTELTEVSENLQTQITQNAEGITSTASSVESIRVDASNAQAKADEASTAASEAQAKANSATQTANEAQEAANTAKTAAEAAQTEATKAQTAADNAATAAAKADAAAKDAQSDLDAAKANLESVSNRVDATEEEIAAAQEAVNTAQEAADKANADAASAREAANAARATADKAKQDAATAQTAADTAQANATTAKEAADRAQATADEANAAIGELSNRVTTAETQISQNAEQISLRATKTEVEEKLSGYSTKTETESSINAMADSINLDVSSKFSELGIGNRNYIRNTRLMEGYGKSSNVTFSTDEEGFAVATFSQVESLSYNNVTTKPPIPFSLLRNKTVTFSILVRSDDFERINAESNRGLLVSFALCTAEETTRTKYHDTAFYATNLSDEWKKITVTHTFSDSFFGSGSGEIDDTTRFMLQIYNYSLYSLQFKKIKLEIGDETTEWVAAQEDEASTIDSLRASLELKVDKDKMISEINASADVITLTGNRFVVDADNFSLTAEGRMTSVAGKIAGWDINEDGLSVAYSGNFPFAGGTLGTAGTANVKLYSKPDSVELEAVQIGSSGVSLKGSSVYAVKILDYHLDDENNTHEGTTTFGIGKDGNTIIHNSSSNYISIGDTVDTYGDMNIYGKIKTKYSIAPMTESSGKFACGLDDARWSTVYSNNVNADGKIYFPGITSSTSVTRTLYMGATAGQLYYKTSQSSKMIKHDVFPLRNEDIAAERLYDLEVVQFKYNEDILSSDDQRYMTDMPGFIIEQMNEVYPIAVDKETENVKDWAWNAQYLIPPMLKLIQGQHKDINGLFSSKNNMSARIDSLNYMLEQAFSEIATIKKENETLKQALA